MLTHRGVAVSSAGLAMWLSARLLGSPALETVSVGVFLVPFLSLALIRADRDRLHVRRHMPETRVSPGVRFNVDVDIRNDGVLRTPPLLLEDHLPPALGRPARSVVAGVHRRSSQRVQYAVLPQVRGRYSIGPLTLDAIDPFGLTRRRIVVDDTDNLIVTPEIEDLSAPSDAASGTGVVGARAKQLMRSGDEYYTLRAFQEGDDLRRIHWPSVARTGQLMIRQHESTRRASAVVFLDARENSLGRAHGAAFERAVSCAASVGVLLARNGFSLRLATADAPAAPFTEDSFLDALAGISHRRIPSLAPALTHLRSGASAESSLVFVGAPPPPNELPPLQRVGSAFGPKLAILVHLVDPATAPPSRRTQLESRATGAMLTLARAGWDCIVISPSMRLTERWHQPRERRLAHSV
jgi:hypothetical protein